MFDQLRTIAIITLLAGGFIASGIVACGGGDETDAVVETDAGTDSDTDALVDTDSPTDSAASAGNDQSAEPTSADAPASEAAEVEQSTVAGGRLALVQSRGELICGVNDQIVGFGAVDPDGEFAGFDIDFCRAIAAAVFGDPQAVSFRPLSAQQRFTALQTGEVDVLIRNTTWTLSRDTQNGLDFSPTTFYDGQGMMVRTDLAVTALEDLEGASICVGSGTTTERNLGDAMREAGADFTPVVFEGADEVFNAYESGRCEAVTADMSALVSRQTTLPDPDSHSIMDIVLSKEPLGPAVLQGDPGWADVVNWVVFGIIQAEEFGITSDNVDTFLGGDVPEMMRFLGEEAALGEGLGLSNDFMIDVIRAVGNYGEIYDRHLGPDTPFDLPRGSNRLWTDGGLLYSPPFN